eukprot:COSAG01_NODE_21650_length_892_cov_0.688525_1_plen_267_part_00
MASEELDAARREIAGADSDLAAQLEVEAGLSEARLHQIEEYTKRCADMEARLEETEKEKRAIQRRYEDRLEVCSAEAERTARVVADAEKARQAAEAHAEEERQKLLKIHAGFEEVQASRETEQKKRREAEAKLAVAKAEIDDIAKRQQADGDLASGEKAELEAANESAERRIELLQQQHKAELAQIQQEFELQRMQSRVEKGKSAGTETLMHRLQQAQAAQMKARAASKAAQEQLEQRARMDKADSDDYLVPVFLMIRRPPRSTRL